MRFALPVLVLSVAATLQSQAIQVPPAGGANQPSVTIRQTVNNVLIDVVVSDKNGLPVKNLTKERFQVMQDGVAQPIAFFEEHQAEPAPAPFAHPLQLPPNIYTNFPTTAPYNGPTLVLLMDALNTPAIDQPRVRAAMLNYLRKIPPGCNIAIFALTSKLHMIQGFNGDPAKLIAAIDQIGTWQKQNHLTDESGEDSYADSMPKDFGGAATPLFQAFVAHEQSWRVDERVGFTLDGLNALATYLSALPGRKNLIWFSGSFPFGLGADSTTPHGAGSFQTENLSRSRDYSADLHSTSELLKLARVAVYPMDPTALATPSMFNSAEANNDTLRGGAAGRTIAQESADEMASHFTMDTIAEDTGGRAFHNTNDLAGAISTVTQLGANYYTIAYVPKDKTYDGKYRKVVIKVDVPKAKLDYRRGYFAEDPDKSGANALAHPSRTAAVLLRGAPAATDILFKARVAPADAAAGAQIGAARYSVNWSVDLHGLNMTPSTSGMRRGNLELAVVAYNGDSKAVNTVSTPVSLILSPDEYRLYLKSGLQFHQELELPTGPVYLRIAIVDTDSQRAGATEIPLNVVGR